MISLTKYLVSYIYPFSKTENILDKNIVDKNIVDKNLREYTTIKLFSTIPLKNDGYDLTINPSKKTHKNLLLKIKLNKTKSASNKQENPKFFFDFFVLLKKDVKYEINFIDDKINKGLKPIKFICDKNINSEDININRLFSAINKLDNTSEIKLVNNDYID